LITSDTIQMALENNTQDVFRKLLVVRNILTPTDLTEFVTTSNDPCMWRVRDVVCFVFYRGLTKRDVLRLLNFSHATHKFVVGSSVSSVSRTILQNNGFEFISIKLLSNYHLVHTLVPSYKVLTTTEASRVDSLFKTRRDQWPVMLPTDPCAIFLGAGEGDLVFNQSSGTYRHVHQPQDRVHVSI